MARRAGFQMSKEGIIKVSIKQIARSGFSNFTLSNLSKELNITKAALYWHFKNKDDILLEILKYIELEYISVIKGICDNKELSPSERMKGFLTFIYNKSGEDMNLCIVPSKLLLEFLYKESKFHEEIREIYANYKDSVSRILIDGILEGEFRKDISPVNYSRFVVGSLDGILQQCISDHTSPTKAFNKVDSFLELYTNLLV